MKQLQAQNTLHLEHVSQKWNGTSEEWLDKLVNHCLNILEIKGYDTNKWVGNGIKIHISNTRGVKTKANGYQGRALGWCYSTSCSNDNYREIEVDREYSQMDTWKVIKTVAHEVTHAILPEDYGHNYEFYKIVRDVFGLVGKWATPQYTNATKSLFKQFVEINGLFPHSGINADGKRQTTRMVKVACLNAENCVGGTQKSYDQGYGLIFRLSSASIRLAKESGSSIKCPVCHSKTWNETLPTGLYQ